MISFIWVDRLRDLEPAGGRYVRGGGAAAVAAVALP
jgi:hypothetical protein